MSGYLLYQYCRNMHAHVVIITVITVNLAKLELYLKSYNIDEGEAYTL